MSIRLLGKLFVASAAVLLGTHTAKALPVVIFNDNFDAETTTNFPSTWTIISGGGANQTVIDDPAAPTQDNSFELDNPTNITSQLHRTFPTVSLSSSDIFRFEYDLNVVNVENLNVSGQRGAVLGLRVAPAGNTISAALLRVQGAFNGLSDPADTWRPTDHTTGNFLTVAPLNENQYYHFAIDIFPTTGDPTSGLYQWSIDNIAVTGLLAYSGHTEGTLSAVNYIFAFTGNGNGDLDTNFHLDNIQLSVPEPAGLSLLALGGALAFRRRSR